MKKISLLIVALALMVAFIGVATAEQPVRAVPSSTGIVDSTDAVVYGTLTQTDSLAMQLTNNPMQISTLTATGFPDDLGAFGPGVWAAVVAQINSLGGTITWHFATPAEILLAAAPGDVMVTQWSMPSGSLATLEQFTGLSFQAYFNAAALLPGVVMTTTNEGLHTGTLRAGETRETTSYASTLNARGGLSDYSKNSVLNTGNQILGGSNFGPVTTLAFAGIDDGGHAVGSEEMTLDSMGSATRTSDVMTCPFGPTQSAFVPPYCNIIMVGSKFDLAIGTVTSDANERFVGTDAGVANVVNYDFAVSPYNTATGPVTAFGSAEAYVNAHTMEGRTDSNTISQDMTYSEHTSANGFINGFHKSIKWQSGPIIV